MRPAMGGRWIVGILIIGPMVLVQLIHITLIVQAGASQAQLYGDEFTFAEYWVRSGTAGMLVRALLTLGLFCLCLAMVFGKKDFMTSRTERVVALLAFGGWLCLMLI